MNAADTLSLSLSLSRKNPTFRLPCFFDEVELLCCNNLVCCSNVGISHVCFDNNVFHFFAVKTFSCQVSTTMCVYVCISLSAFAIHKGCFYNNKKAQKKQRLSERRKMWMCREDSVCACVWEREKVRVSFCREKQIALECFWLCETEGGVEIEKKGNGEWENKKEREGERQREKGKRRNEREREGKRKIGRKRERK